ncbi:MAG: hypothetical protein Q8M65_08080 [Rhodoglobus sp.]|nr:hypothetical protein [Rhodoglobus sp.]
MNHVIAIAPTLAIDLTSAVAIAVAVTSVVALVMLVMMLRRTVSTSKFTVGVSAASALAVLVGALLVGGSLTQSPTAAASETSTPRGAGTPSIELKLTGLQLPTL